MRPPFRASGPQAGRPTADISSVAQAEGGEANVLDRLRGEDGFTLIEAVVSLVVFALLASLSASVLIGMLNLTRTNDKRAVAVGLASRQVEAARGQQAAAIPDGTTATTVPVNGTDYKVQQTSSF